ncbi:leucine-rich repeat-containing protein, partial [Asbolus verrucosus]
NLQTILMSIEERLRNLDNIYSMHLSPTLEDKFEQYQRKLESIDTKILRLESLMMLNLDKISENISTKNFKDDIAKTNLMKKMDAIYEGVSHRLNYMDRKFETSNIKIQNKLETTLTRLEKMDEGFTRRNEDIEVELSDAIAAIDDLKTSYQIMEENIVNNTNENFEVSLKEQMELMKSFNDKSIQALESLYENTTKVLDGFDYKIENGLAAIHEVNESLENFETEIKRELNEYAVKVAEMNSENWNTASVLKNKQNVLENIINSTKTEVQNGVRALMVLIGKISNKEQLPQADESPIDKLHEKIDANFEKVFSAQNLFMDNCYRLQMDESQIESKISDILEKLIDTFEKKTAVEIKDIKNLEKLIKSHDSHITRNLYQASTNIVSIHEKITKGHHQFETDLKQVTDHLNALFSLVQDTLADENGSLSAKNVGVSTAIKFINNKILLHDLNEIVEKITFLNKQGDILTNSVEEIKNILETSDHKNSSQVINEYFKNISQTITGMEAKINTVYLYYYFNRSKIEEINLNLTQKLQKFIDTINISDYAKKPTTEISQVHSENNDATLNPIRNEDVSQTVRNEKIHHMITEIFGVKAQSNETSQNTENEVPSHFLNVIDLRNNFDGESEDDNSTTEAENSDEQGITEKVMLDADQTTLKQSGEYDDFKSNNWQQVTV